MRVAFAGADQQLRQRLAEHVCQGFGWPRNVEESFAVADTTALDSVVWSMLTPGTSEDAIEQAKDQTRKFDLVFVINRRGENAYECASQILLEALLFAALEDGERVKELAGPTLEEYAAAVDYAIAASLISRLVGEIRRDPRERSTKKLELLLESLMLRMRSGGLRPKISSADAEVLKRWIIHVEGLLDILPTEEIRDDPR